MSAESKPITRIDQALAVLFMLLLIGAMAAFLFVPLRQVWIVSAAAGFAPCLRVERQSIKACFAPLILMVFGATFGALIWLVWWLRVRPAYGIEALSWESVGFTLLATLFVLFFYVVSYRYPSRSPDVVRFP